MKLLLTVRGVMGSTVVRTSSKSEAPRKTDGPCLYKNQKGKAEHGPVIVAFTSALDAKPLWSPFSTRRCLHKLGRAFFGPFIDERRRHGLVVEAQISVRAFFFPSTISKQFSMV
jgi:hypothetical protein